jgi:divalent metal cation (Fe/Co/Zn/Cd) transporter
LSWIDFIRRAKAPELPVVLLEDFAALVGLVLALLGVSLTLLTGNGIWDAVGTGAIGVLLVVVAIALAMETRSLLIGEAASEENLAAIVQAITAGDEVERIIHMRTSHISPDELLVAAKVAVRHDDTAATVARNIDAIEARIRAAVPIATVIYLEPDLDRADRAGS